MYNASASWGAYKGYEDPGVEGVTLTTNPLFYVNLDSVEGGGQTPEVAKLTTGLMSMGNLNGNFNETTCFLESATLEYDVVINGETVSIPEQSDQGRLIAFANNTAQGNSLDESLSSEVQLVTMSALTYWLSIFVQANASLVLPVPTPKEAVYTPWAKTFNTEVIKHTDNSGARYGAYGFIDPIPHVIFKFNQLMFRGAVASASWSNTTSLMDNGLSVDQTVPAKQKSTRPVYKTDLSWYAAAVIFELIAMLLILPMFWGWWTIGRQPTLSPFGVALAFDSPILEKVNSGVNAQGIVREVGGMKIKFGEVISGVPAQSEASDKTCSSSTRLGMAEDHNVVRPRKGVRFSR